MKLNKRLAVEVVGLVAIVTAVFLATGHIWPALLAVAASAFYLAFAWEPDQGKETITWNAPSLPKWVKRGKTQTK